MELFDLIIIVVVGISGLLALMRGFTREVLTLLSWIVAGVAAWWAVQMPPVLEFARQYVSNQKLAVIVTGAAAFLLALLIMSIVTVRITDWVLDTAIGPFDRTLGGLFGLLRGLVLVTVAWMLYVPLVPPEKHPEWITNARLLPLVRGTADIISELVPEETAEMLRRTMAAGRDKASRTASEAARGAVNSIGKGDARRLRNLMEQ